MTDKADHWQRVYDRQGDDAVSWFEADPALSLRLVRQWCRPGGRVIDVGAGRSRLAGRLAAEGWRDVTVLDLSAHAVEAARAALPPLLRGRVTGVVGDVTRFAPERRFDLWHDRAVFHFLTTAAERRAYVEALDRSLTPAGVAIIMTFASDGPERCSGLPVCRYDGEDLAAEIDQHCTGCFEAIAGERFVHLTPRGAEQRFQALILRRSAARRLAA